MNYIVPNYTKVIENKIEYYLKEAARLHMEADAFFSIGESDLHSAYCGLANEHLKSARLIDPSVKYQPIIDSDCCWEKMFPNGAVAAFKGKKCTYIKYNTGDQIWFDDQGKVYKVMTH